MNQRVYSILFSALLASTLVHEIRAKAAANPSFAAHVLERAANPPQTCELICDFSSNSTTSNTTYGLSVTANVTAGFIVVVNGTANVALIIDVNNSVIVLLNGNTGDVVIIYINTSKGLYISGGGWVASKTSIQIFLAGFSLKTLSEISGAVSFQVSSASSTILKATNEVVGFLYQGIRVELQANATLGLQIIIASATQFITVIRSLKGFLELIGSKLINVRHDLAQLLNILQVFGLIFSKISGGIAALGGAINLTVILNAESGLQILTILILASVQKPDIVKVLSGLLNEVEASFNVIAQIGGNENVGLNGLFKVVAKIVSYINEHTSTEIMITAVIQYMAQTGQTVSRQEFLSALSLILEAIGKAGAAEILAGFVTTIKALINGTLVIRGVSISAIIELLISGAVKGGLYIIVAVLLELKAIAAASVLIPMCFFVLILQIKSAIGIQMLKALGIAIDISIGAISGSIIAVITKSIFSILHGDFYAVLESIPVIGKITVAFNAAISAASSGSYNLKTLLKASALIQNLIKGWLQWLTGIQLVSSTYIAQAKSMTQSCTGVSAFYSISINASSS